MIKKLFQTLVLLLCIGFAATAAAKPIFCAYIDGETAADFHHDAKNIAKYPFIHDFYTSMIIFNMNGHNDLYLPFNDNFKLPKQDHLHGIIFLNHGTSLNTEQQHILLRQVAIQSVQPAWQSIAFIKLRLGCRHNQNFYTFIKRAIKLIDNKPYLFYVDPRFLDGTYQENLTHLKAHLNTKASLIIPVSADTISTVPSVLSALQKNHIHYYLLFNALPKTHLSPLLAQVRQALTTQQHTWPKTFKGIIAAGWLGNKAIPSDQNIQQLRQFLAKAPQ